MTQNSNSAALVDSSKAAPSTSKHPMRVQRRRMSSKVAVLSPEVRRAAEERDRQMIEEFMARGRVTQCPTRWAAGAVNTNLLGGSES